VPVPKGTPQDPERTRSGMIAASTALFYERGLDGVGVAELCRAVGASKETLYRHFGSKDGLVEAVLQERSERVGRWLRRAVEDAGDDAADQLVALFGALGRWYAEPGFRGCAIVNASAQQHGDPARSVVAVHLNRHLDVCTRIAVRAGAADPALLGRQLLALLEGATVLADHHGRGAAAADDALQAALVLLRTAAPPPR
jgi:AcrR family transcriptional regulator